MADAMKAIGQPRPPDEIIGDPTIADAILDRIIHTAHRINLSGESLRTPAGRQELE